MKAFTAAIVLLVFTGVSHASSAPATCAALQAELHQLSSMGGGTYQFVAGHILACSSRAELYRDFVSRHGLLIPESVVLDLNGGRIDLHLTGGDYYGVRLSSHSHIRNGDVFVATSSGAGSQGIFHSAISVGAAYGDGGAPDKPSYFSNIRDWSIRNVRVSQPYAHAAIAIMSEAHDGLIEHVDILPSNEAVVGIALDWGTVGEFHSQRDLLAAMHKLHQAHLPGTNIPYVYTTHPHHIVIRDVDVGALKFTPDPNDKTKKDNDDRAAIRTSAVHNVEIRDIIVDEAGAGIVLRAGDVGYVFAREDADGGHRELVVEDFTIHKARIRGVIVDGLADNAVDASALSGCERLNVSDSQRIWSPWVRFGTIRGQFAASAAAGVYLKYVDRALIEKIDSQEFWGVPEYPDQDPQEFGNGIQLENAVTNSTVWRSKFLRNSSHGVLIKGGSVAPINNAIVDNEIYENVRSIRDHGVATQCVANQFGLEAPPVTGCPAP